MAKSIRNAAPGAQPIVSGSDSDSALLKRISRKDRQAFEKFYFSYHRRLFQFLLRLVHSREAAEELLNDVMMVVWQQASAFKGNSKVSTWVFGIAFRKALKMRERLKRNPQISLDEVIGGIQDTAASSNPEKWLADSEFSSHLSRKIDRLGIAHRSVVQLTALGYSYKEIGEIVDCPENTVKTRMFHARRQLKRSLSETQYQYAVETGGKV